MGAQGYRAAWRVEMGKGARKPWVQNLHVTLPANSVLIMTKRDKIQ